MPSLIFRHAEEAIAYTIKIIFPGIKKEEAILVGKGNRGSKLVLIPSCTLEVDEILPLVLPTVLKYK